VHLLLIPFKIPLLVISHLYQCIQDPLAKLEEEEVKLGLIVNTRAVQPVAQHVISVFKVGIAPMRQLAP
jgi:hypothetical protein